MTTPREVDVRTGYDRWAATYDETPNPLVVLDRWHAITHLAPRPGEVVLDAGCGTGGHFEALLAAGARPVGVDLSLGMLRRARRRSCPVVAADLGGPLPFGDRVFDAVLCSLVSEHLADPHVFFSETRRVLRPGGRLVFSGLHPDRAAHGVAANFEADGERIQMAAATHVLDDFAQGARGAGLLVVSIDEYPADQRLIDAVAKAERYRGLPLLFVMTARRPSTAQDSS